MVFRDPNLSQALGEIAAIRGQLARAAEFRGYGPATLAATAALAALAALGQPRWVVRPLAAPAHYVLYWSAAAVAAAALIAFEAVARTRRLHVGIADAMIRAAIGQFLPAAIAGLSLTLVLLCYAPEHVRLLPGLWQIIFSLGVFATCRFLPRPMLVVGGWYLACGLFFLAASGGGSAFAPWTMGGTFALGQSMAAAILWRAGAAREVADAEF